MKKFAFLLLVFLILSGSAFAITADAGGPETTTSNVMVLLEGTCNDEDIIIKSCVWTITPECDLEILDESGIESNFVTVSVEVTCDESADYIATLTAINDNDEPDTDDTQITVNANIAPVVSNVRIEPENPKTTDELTCNYDYIDTENDPDASTFKWFNEEDEEVGVTNQPLSSTLTIKDDVLKCEVTAKATQGTILGNVDQSTGVTIENSIPEVILSGDPVSGEPGLEVTFTGECTDADNDLETCEIDFGDDSSEVGFVSPMQYIYETAGTYAAKLTATDSENATGDDSKEITVTASVAPSINNKSPANGTYTNDNTPTISFEVNDNGDGINISTLAIFVNGEEKTPETSESGDDYNVSWTSDPAISDGIISVGVRVENNSANIADANWSFTIDTAPPTLDDISVAGYTDDSRPSISLQSVSGNPAEMALSCNGSDWKNWQDYFETVTNFNITNDSYGCLDGDEDSVTIYLKLRDETGNESDSENVSTTYDNSNPDSPELDSADEGNEEVYLDWDAASDNGPSGIKEYIIYKNNSEIDTTTNTYYNVENLNNGIEYDFKIKARDKAGNVSSSYSNVLSATPSSSGSDTTDTTPPYLNWTQPASGSRDNLSGIVTLRVSCYDNDGTSLHPIRFYIDDGTLSIGNGTKAGDSYSLEWDSKTVVDGTHTIKALAKNRSGNDNDTRIKTITVTTNNGITEIDDGADDTPDDDEDKVAAEEAIDDAQDSKENVDSLLAELDVLGIALDADQAELLKEARDLLDEAQEEFDDEDYDTAIEKAEEAIAKLEELTALITVASYVEGIQYVNNEENI